jgi:hypothetical protein
MKITTKLSLAAIVASLTIASSAFANGLVGETSNYRIYSYQVGNSQPAIFYVTRQASVAVNVNGASVGSGHAASAHRNESGHFQVSIPGGIN